MKYRFAIRSNNLYTPSFALSTSSSGVFLTVRDPFLNEKRSVHFANDVKYDKRHLYRGLHGTRPKKRKYEVVGNGRGGRLTPEYSYLLGRFSLCASDKEFHSQKSSGKIEIFDYDLGKNDIVTIHLVSAPREHHPDCPPSFNIVKEVAEGPTKWMLILEEKAVHSVYDMVTRSVLSNQPVVVVHGVAKSEGIEEVQGIRWAHKHSVLVCDLHDDYRPQRHAQMSLVIANKDLEARFTDSKPEVRGYIVRK